MMDRFPPNETPIMPMPPEDWEWERLDKNRRAIVGTLNEEEPDAAPTRSLTATEENL